MGDITDLYSTISRVRVSPQKAYNASNALTTGFVTMATLTVVNGQYFGAIFSGNGGNTGGNVTVELVQGATVLQTIIITTGSNSNDIYSMTNIFQNTSGSNAIITIQAKGSNTSVLITNISLLSGSFIIGINQLGRQSYPVNAYITNLEFIGGTIGTNLYGSLNGINLNSATTTILLSSINIVVNSIEFFTVVNGFSNSTTTLNPLLGLIAFDFDGKTLAL